MKCKAAGFSLVELMVAMVLGLVLLTGVGQIFLATNKSWTLNDELARVQENARVAMDILGGYIRSASYTGCPTQSNLANGLKADSDSREWMAHFDKGILGFSSGTDTRNRIDSNAISEAIVIHSIDREQGVTISGHDVSNATLSLTNNHDYDSGDLLALITEDCQQVSVFRAGATTGSKEITHSSGGGSNLSNCTSDLKGDFDCQVGSMGAESMSHQSSMIAPLNSYAFYLRDSNSIPTLYRKKAGEYVSGNSVSAEALVEGIENIRLLYGVDTDSDGVANRYRTASDLGLFSTDWLKVTSVKLELLVRSLIEIAEKPQMYFFAGNRVEPDDLYVRRQFVTTIELRNRAQ
ncbi:hypothetical protein ACH42_16020 [Endozoicomonas sp. (ex Bugula neritina AB1)]|nr:hypothetical protein ACH42_16020 [Endozoicomonas sp. (ex Bugula neritina AB1)]